MCDRFFFIRFKLFDAKPPKLKIGKVGTIILLKISFLNFKMLSINLEPAEVSRSIYVYVATGSYNVPYYIKDICYQN